MGSSVQTTIDGGLGRGRIGEPERGGVGRVGRERDERVRRDFGRRDRIRQGLPVGAFVAAPGDSAVVIDGVNGRACEQHLANGLRFGEQGDQVKPASKDLNRPAEVAAYKVDGRAGSMASEFTVRAGRLVMARQVPPPSALTYIGFTGVSDWRALTAGKGMEQARAGEVHPARGIDGNPVCGGGRPEQTGIQKGRAGGIELPHPGLRFGRRRASITRDVDIAVSVHGESRGGIVRLTDIGGIEELRTGGIELGHEHRIAGEPRLARTGRPRLDRVGDQGSGARRSRDVDVAGEVGGKPLNRGGVPVAERRGIREDGVDQQRTAVVVRAYLKPGAACAKDPVSAGNRVSILEDARSVKPGVPDEKVGAIEAAPGVEVKDDAGRGGARGEFEVELDGRFGRPVDQVDTRVDARISDPLKLRNTGPPAGGVSSEIVATAWKAAGRERSSGPAAEDAHFQTGRQQERPGGAHGVRSRDEPAPGRRFEPDGKAGRSGKREQRPGEKPQQAY